MIPLCIYCHRKVHSGSMVLSGGRRAHAVCRTINALRTERGRM